MLLKLNHYSRVAVCALLLLVMQGANAESAFQWAPQFKVGDVFPDTTLLDQNGEPHVLSEGAGDKGYLVVLNRSVVW